MKRVLLGLLVGLSIANADLLNISIEADEQMAWRDAKKYCAAIDKLRSFDLPTAKFMESLSAEDNALLQNDRYWLDEIKEPGMAEAYGVYGIFNLSVVKMYRDNKLRVLCVKKEELQKKK